MQAGEFNLAQFLSDQGMELSRMDASGNPVVKTPSGQEMAMELPRFLEDHGIDPKASKIIYNTPEKGYPLFSPLYCRTSRLVFRRSLDLKRSF
jgi:ABC-type ATPase with predicted acetyltransferase domain